ncbi:Site-specific recombinase XerD [Methylomagnum ishizawai]|uniref:Site-specific recombinase XerD n=1 Tax=Methylomagnum ishizawai TaxID=1760988 RepID=A0A1Y6D4T6_9GAMM|nr:tyrosine-type recombinase/integrase [Methylomagnum ishizawai]SMF95873.1 Site-specific recombinase XerD [Methylomagnum ishizawai]
MSDPKFNFTQASLTALAAPERRTYYGDTTQRHLFVSVHPSGEKTFYVVRKVGGKPVRVMLGRFDPGTPGNREIPADTDPLDLVGNAASLNIRMARALASAVNVQLDRGINPATERKRNRQAKEAEPTLRQAFERYYRDHLIPHGKRTAEELRGDFARYLGIVPTRPPGGMGPTPKKPECAVDWERRKLSSIQPEEVRRWMVGLKDGIGPRTANKAFALLRAIYRKAGEWRLYVGDDPCEGIPKFPERERSRFLQGHELPAFFEALGRCESDNFRHYILLSLATGARKGNVLAMRWADLDFTAGLWTIPGEKSKSGDPMVIPLTSIAREVLAARRGNGGEWVFPSRAACGHITDFQKPWDDLLKAAGLEDVRLHDLRRSLGSWTAMQGASLAIVGRALGHRSSDATHVYARLHTDPVLDAMERGLSAMLAHGGVTEAGNVVSLKPSQQPPTRTKRQE